jgi:hypothetical protein
LNYYYLNYYYYYYCLPLPSLPSIDELPLVMHELISHWTQVRYEIERNVG